MSVQSCRGAVGGKPKRAGVYTFLVGSSVSAIALATPPRTTPNPPPANMELTPTTMESMPNANPVDHGRNFLTGGRSEGMNEAQFCSNLGDNPRTQRLDRDNFAFDGTAGEEISIGLAADGANFSGTHASLAISDQIRNIQFFRADHSALPNALRGKLPATGRYVIAVQENQGTARETPFLGDYCLTFRSTGAAAASLRPTDSVEGAENVPPTANAGPDQTAVDTNGDGSESVQLDGSQSKDPDGRLVSFDWSENGKSLAQGAQPRVSLAVGRHDLTLTVTDNDGATAKDNVQIMVEENTAECAVDEDCPDDQNACTDTYCVNGACENVAIEDIECNDHDACTIETCDPNDGCQYSAVNCDDNNACTLDSCDPTTGCAHTAVTCDDNNGCTTDTCDGALGCRFANNTSSCDDGDSCTNNDRCAGGSCAGTPLSCNDGLFCTGSESCDDGQCVTTGSPCVAGQVCDENSNACVECLTAVHCNDGDDCTADTCKNGNCQNTTITGCCETNGDCDDGSLCTIDRCTNNQCTHSARNCSDNNACTLDTCSTVTGCLNTSISCDDGNVCTDDSCDPAFGCENQPNTVSCDDDDFCTLGDTCSNGVCGGPSVECDDGLFCNGAEICNSGDCASSGNPCADGQFCDEVNGCTGLARTSNPRNGTTSTVRPTMSSTATSSTTTTSGNRVTRPATSAVTAPAGGVKKKK